MALKTISFYIEGNNTTNVNIFMTVQTAIVSIINTVAVSIKDGSNCFTNADLPAGLTYAGIGTVSVNRTGCTRRRAYTRVTVCIRQTGIARNRAHPFPERLAVQQVVAVDIRSWAGNDRIVMTHSTIGFLQVVENGVIEPERLVYRGGWNIGPHFTKRNQRNH